MPKGTIFTIGHSVHDSQIFLNLLKEHSVNCVVDVRSSPFSVRAPQFNKEILKEYLSENNIVYLHFPKAFGARQKDPELLDETGRVDFEKVRQSEHFKEGLGKLYRCLERKYTIALMCSEANPLDCHRFGMISYKLVREGLSVKHILKNGEILDNDELEKILLSKYIPKLVKRSLFDNRTNSDTPIEFAYKLRNKDIGFLVDKKV